jgi:hypothetical protein
MTNPTLSIQEKTLGRFYQLPDGTLPKEIDRKTAIKAYEAGTIFPSITSIIGKSGKDFSDYNKFAAIREYKTGASFYQSINAGSNWMNYAANRGTAVHAILDEYCSALKNNPSISDDWTQFQGWEDIVSYQAEGYLDGFRRFCDTYQPTFNHLELTVYGTTDRSKDGFSYAGTGDFIGTINGYDFIGDWKTGGIHNTLTEQLNAVRNSSHRAEGDTLQPHNLQDHRMIGVRLFVTDNRGDYEVQEVNPEGFEIFKASRLKWDHNTFEKKALTKWKN